MSQEIIREPITPESEIIGVTTSEQLSGIPLNTWGNVRSALITFTEKNRLEIHGPRETLTQDQKRHLERRSTLFIDNMLKAAQPVVDGGNGHWKRFYDYDGDASFYKTEVDIRKAPESNAYLLGLNSVTDEGAEAKLAEELKIERGLLWKKVGIQFKPNGDNFEIDFLEIAQRFQDIENQLRSTPISIPKENKEERRREAELTAEVIIMDLLARRQILFGNKNDVGVSLSLWGEGDRYQYKSNGEVRKDLWGWRRFVLSGPLGRVGSTLTLSDKSLGKEGETVPTSVIFTVRRYGNNYKPSDLPATHPSMKATMNRLASEIADSFNQRL